MSFFTHIKFTASVLLLLNEKNNFNSQFTIFKSKCKCEVFMNFQLFENLGKEVKKFRYKGRTEKLNPNKSV